MALRVARGGPPRFFFAKFFLAFLEELNLILNLEPLPKNYKLLFDIKNCLSNFQDRDGTGRAGYKRECLKC